MTPLLLIPGMMCDARLYRSQIEAFSHRVAIQIAPISGHASMTRLAVDILAHAPPAFALAGLSMGGVIAMEIYSQAPERVEKLALIDTNLYAEIDEVKNMRELQIERVQRGQLLSVMREIIPKYFVPEQTPDTDIVNVCEAMAASSGADAFIRQSLALRERSDQRETLKKVAVPTLILCGDGDQLCPVERHILMHSLILNSHLEVLQGVGHLPTLQRPEAVNAAMGQWLFSK